MTTDDWLLAAAAVCLLINAALLVATASTLRSIERRNERRSRR